MSAAVEARTPPLSESPPSSTNKYQWLREVIEDRVQKAQTWEQKRQAFRSAVVGWARMDGGAHVELADQWLEEMVRRRLKPDLVMLTDVMVALIGQGSGNKAEQWHRRMATDEQAAKSWYKPNTKTFTRLIGAAVKRDDSSEVDRWLECMDEFGVEPDIWMFNSMIDTAAKRGEWCQVNQLFQRMKGQRVKPDIVTFTSMIDAAAKCGKWVQVNQLLQCMERHGVEPNIVMFDSLIAASTNQDDIVKAEQWLERMRQQGVIATNLSFNCVISVFKRQSNGDKAALWFERMINEGLSPDLVTCHCVVAAWAKQGVVDKALLCLERMISEFGLNPWEKTFSSIVNARGQYHGDKQADVYRKLESLAKQCGRSCSPASSPWCSSVAPRTTSPLEPQDGDSSP